MGDLKRKNMHHEVKFVYLPSMEVIINSNPPFSPPLSSLTSNTAMEVGASTQQPPASIVTSKVVKSKSKKIRQPEGM